MSTSPTQIVDKNGKLTTVHKSIDKQAASPRLNQLGAKPSKYDEKRTAVKLSSKYRGEWSDSDKIELGQKLEDGRQRIYFNGLVIGSVSSDIENQYKKVAGTRQIRMTGKVLRWRTNSTDTEDVISQLIPTSRNDTATRVSAITLRVNSYIRRKAERQEFVDYVNSGGLVVQTESDYDKKASSVLVRGEKLNVPDGYTARVPKDLRISGPSLSMIIESGYSTVKFDFGGVDESSRGAITLARAGFNSLNVSIDEVMSDSPDVRDWASRNIYNQQVLDDVRGFLSDVIDTESNDFKITA